MKPDAPESYVVVPGDTLWSIAQRYTDSPWRWTELWSQNKDEIKNPSRIYPGNVIVLDRTQGRLTLSDTTVKLSPRVRAESIAQAAIPSIPPSIIEPFLVRPLVIEPDGLDKAPTIIASEDQRVSMERGDRAFVRGIEDSKDASTWFVYRQGRPLVDPDSNTTLGYEAIYLGTARVVRAGAPSLIVLTSVTQEVQLGDKLVAAGKPEIPTFTPRAPSTRVEGRIISLYGDNTQVSETGPLTVITINRGRSQGVEVGNVLAILRSGKGLQAEMTSSMGSKKGQPFTVPNERYGVAFVFRVFDRVSYALVMNITRPVNKLDLVQNP
ncbi:MAG TPA: LysM domain-containing protein [Burkholderiales bacterium]|nr:LysM domain-containing protein [Burkholderiales bacterium]